MSHFTTVKTQIRDLTHLLKALETQTVVVSKTGGAQIGVVEGALMRGYQGAQKEADVVYKLSKYDVGFQLREDGTYEAEADWWGVGVSETNARTGESLTMEDFMNEVRRRYAQSKVTAEVQARGFVLAGNAVEQADGSLQLVARKW